MLQTEIEKLTASETLVSVCLDDADNTNIIGYFLKSKAHVILMQMVSDQGLSDGYTVFEPELVLELNWGSQELGCIEQLFTQKSNLTQVLLAADSLQQAMIELNHKYGIVGFFEYTNSDQFEVAKIMAHDENWLKLYCLGSKRGLLTQYKLMLLDKVCRVEFDTPYLRDMVALHA